MPELELVMAPEEPKMPTEAEMDKEYQARLERCIPVARKLLDIVHGHMPEIVLGEANAVKKSLTPVAEEILALFLKENIHWGDREFILQIAMQPVVGLVDVLQSAYSISWDKVMRKALGKDALDLTFSDVDDVLKKE